MTSMGRHLSRSLVYQLKQPRWNRFFMKSHTNLHSVSVYLGHPRVFSNKSKDSKNNQIFGSKEVEASHQTSTQIPWKNQSLKVSHSKSVFSMGRRRVRISLSWDKVKGCRLHLSQLNVPASAKSSDSTYLNQQRSFCKNVDGEDCVFEPLPKPEPPKCSRISRKRKHLLDQKNKAADTEVAVETESDVKNLDEAVDELKFKCMLASEKKDCERKQYKALCEQLRSEKPQGDAKAVDSLLKCMLTGIRKACAAHAQKMVCQKKYAEVIAAEEAARKEKEKREGKPLDCSKPVEDDEFSSLNKADKKKAKEEAALKRLLQEIKAKCKKQREEAERKMKEEAELKKKCAEAEFKKNCEELAAKKKCEEAAAKKKCEEEAAKKKCEEEAAKNKCEAEAAKKKCLDAASKNKCDEAAAKKKCEEAAAKKKCEEAAAKKKCEEAAAKKKCEEAAAKKKCEEAAAKKKCEEAAAKKKCEKSDPQKNGPDAEALKKCDQDKKKKCEEAEKKKKTEEAALKKKCDEAKQKKKCEAEKKKQNEESEKKRDCELAEFKKKCNELKKKLKEDSCDKKN
ncbi:axoneme-associated protein mst101(2) [Drosophila takahashii]|uniref:axoneme-associated protein mst101(2) n=1 Tax=Drosophila takahashii TaxID=29030 RepID=UPI003898DCA6